MYLILSESLFYINNFAVICSKKDGSKVINW
ncbi:MAG: hypothetical protein KatS3mg027_0352 [Bacteroidia bacterium]|nr:MAG: hypothetical protein KatS3mg027_0352 [Bacteroidia bacterium]